MRRVLTLFGLLLIAFGGFRGYEMYDFVSHARQVEATVIAVEPLPGPPKPRNRIPLHVRFVTPSGEERLIEVRMPLFMQIKEGEKIPVLVDQRDTQRAKIPLLSELWSGPTAWALAGIGAILLSIFAPRRKPR